MVFPKEFLNGNKIERGEAAEQALPHAASTPRSGERWLFPFLWVPSFVADV
jgi:hypothetical protein